MPGGAAPEQRRSCTQGTPLLTQRAAPGQLQPPALLREWLLRRIQFPQPTTKHGLSGALPGPEQQSPQEGLDEKEEQDQDTPHLSSSPNTQGSATTSVPHRSSSLLSFGNTPLLSRGPSFPQVMTKSTEPSATAHNGKVGNEETASPWLLPLPAPPYRHLTPGQSAVPGAFRQVLPDMKQPHANFQHSQAGALSHRRCVFSCLLKWLK